MEIFFQQLIEKELQNGHQILTQKLQQNTQFALQAFLFSIQNKLHINIIKNPLLHIWHTLPQTIKSQIRKTLIKQIISSSLYQQLIYMLVKLMNTQGIKVAHLLKQMIQNMMANKAEKKLLKVLILIYKEMDSRLYQLSSSVIKLAIHLHQNFPLQTLKLCYYCIKTVSYFQSTDYKLINDTLGDSIEILVNILIKVINSNGLHQEQLFAIKILTVVYSDMPNFMKQFFHLIVYPTLHFIYRLLQFHYSSLLKQNSLLTTIQLQSVEFISTIYLLKYPQIKQMKLSLLPSLVKFMMSLMVVSNDKLKEWQAQPQQWLQQMDDQTDTGLRNRILNLFSQLYNSFNKVFSYLHIMEVIKLNCEQFLKNEEIVQLSKLVCIELPKEFEWRKKQAEIILYGNYVEEINKKEIVEKLIQIIKIQENKWIKFSALWCLTRCKQIIQSMNLIAQISQIIPKLIQITQPPISILTIKLVTSMFPFQLPQPHLFINHSVSMLDKVKGQNIHYVIDGLICIANTQQKYYLCQKLKSKWQMLLEICKSDGFVGSQVLQLVESLNSMSQMIQEYILPYITNSILHLKILIGLQPNPNSVVLNQLINLSIASTNFQVENLITLYIAESILKHGYFNGINQIVNRGRGMLGSLLMTAIYKNIELDYKAAIQNSIRLLTNPQMPICSKENIILAFCYMFKNNRNQTLQNFPHQFFNIWVQLQPSVCGHLSKKITEHVLKNIVDLNFLPWLNQKIKQLLEKEEQDQEQEEKGIDNEESGEQDEQGNDLKDLVENLGPDINQYQDSTPNLKLFFPQFL